ncbi:unnamed protein product [Sordaria macrospora k-hell]|uniref:WGS project CABT00000000 data, contig 2.43 n=2 Tax=Sordaria macrospora TaxID=5147 RepID=F7W879_SORMK|nr:uncharacterized protein SMAC_08228 [Sordaria macrospora k-hell]CCC13724.1 unnamed protein product [Sordaria macrospora k-hell]
MGLSTAAMSSPHVAMHVHPFVWVAMDFAGGLPNRDLALLLAPEFGDEPSSVEAVGKYLPPHMRSWEEGDDIRGVIMYLPKKGDIEDDQIHHVEQIDDKICGHPVVLFKSRIGNTETVDFFPIDNQHGPIQVTSFGREGPYQPGTRVPRFPDCMPIPLLPELECQDPDLSLDLAGGRASLDTASAVNTEKVYTLPFIILKLWHHTHSLATGPRLKRDSFEKMERFSEKRDERRKVIAGDWHNERTAPQPETGTSLNSNTKQSVFGRGEKNKESINWRERKPVPEGGRNNERWDKVRRRESAPEPGNTYKLKEPWRKDPIASRPRKYSLEEASHSSSLTPESNPTTATTHPTPIIPVGLPSSSTTSSWTIPSSSPSPPTTARNMPSILVYPSQSNAQPTKELGVQDDQNKPTPGPSNNKRQKRSSSVTSSTNYDDLLDSVSDVEEGSEFPGTMSPSSPRHSNYVG